MARTPKGTKPNYNAFAKALMDLCAKHQISITACSEGHVTIGRFKAKTYGDMDFFNMEANPNEVILGDKFDHEHNGMSLVHIKRET